MKTQQDSKIRVVALTNLEAMCEHVSGTCHRYEVSKVTAHSVHVQYSNPDEYGNESPMTAIFPAYKSGWRGDEENPRVVMTIQRVTNDNWDGEGHQAFDCLLDCPELFRSSWDGPWNTREQIQATAVTS